ncbi:uncharacterized protein BJX67DRAFT_360306 [Aspergillus lucknowensis]|uniref:Uncharacterized protein n=1 Tax=Aspergillus lucknowensis TaxID=176173 RepID=A0ABR4LJS2_9EURO
MPNMDHSELLNGLMPSEKDGYAWVGLPPPETIDDEHPFAPAAADPKPTPQAMGDNDVDVESIVYINLEKEIPADLQKRLRDLEENLRISGQWLSIKAGILTQRKMNEGQLPRGDELDDKLRRAAYRAKVIEAYMTQNVPWIEPYATDIRKNNINVRKAELHLELLKIVIQGITVPLKVHAKLEAILKKVADGIKAGSQSSSQKQLYSILLSVYKYDERLHAVVPAVRTVYFTIQQDVKKYVLGKSSIEWAQFQLGFVQHDYHFQETVWSGVKEETIKYLKELGVKVIRETPDVPVD